MGRLPSPRPPGRLAAALASALIGAACEPAPPAVAPPVERPNVLLITIDTLRADALGAYGQELPVSPVLDALAAGGVVFEQCAAAAPETLPSHATILTGKQPYAHGVRANSFYALGPEQHTLAEALHGRGYRTVAEVAAAVIGRRTFLDQGFEHYRDLDSADVERVKSVGFEAGGAAAVGPGRVEARPERPASDITRRGLEWLEKLGAQEPFLLWLHYFDPHAPYQPPASDLPPSRKERYLAEVQHVDGQIGRLLEALERLGLDERTLVVVTSDHGEGLGEHGERTHSFFVYQTTLRVPLIFRGPGVRRGARVGSLVRSADVTPTILDLAGAPALDEVQGVSLRPLIEGRESDLGVTGYGESIQPRLLFGAPLLRSIREGDWKYIHKPEPELYDLDSDPGETRNLANAEPARLRRLRKRLGELLGEVSPPDASAPLGETTRRELEALGYVVAAAAPPASDLASLALSGPDPSALADDFLRFSQVHERPEEASYTLRRLHDRYPASAPILVALAETLYASGRLKELERLLQTGVERLSPREGNVLRTHLARVLVRRGKRPEAEAQLRRALEVDPCDLDARKLLVGWLHGGERHAEQLALLEEGARLCPHAADLEAALAYALSTCPAPGLRDGPRALSIARRLASRAEGDPARLEVLGVALAETGDREGALGQLQRALELLGEHGDGAAAERLRRHLAALRAGEPIRD